MAWPKRKKKNCISTTLYTLLSLGLVDPFMRISAHLVFAKSHTGDFLGLGLDL